MSSRNTHDVVGAFAGGAYALYRAPAGMTGANTAAEVIGGVVGGIFGSRAPDVLEPAIHSFHRSTCHSVVALTAVSTGALQQKASPAKALRALADQTAARASAARARGGDPVLLDLLELLFHFAAGFVAATPAGYVSHLALDATTPRSIPLLTRGL